MDKIEYVKLNLISAELIKFNMDENVNPCDDFYEFACGGFVKKTEIPDDQTAIDSFDILNKETKEQIRKMLSKDIQPNELRAFKLAKTLYQSCMNESTFFYILIFIFQ